MKSLATLIKLQKTRVDEQRLILNKLQTRRDEIINQINALERQKLHEQNTAGQSVEARTTYGAFLKKAIHEGREFEKQRQAVEAAIQIALDKLAELFEEQKRYEIAQANRTAQEQREERRRERIELDEIGGMTHERKKKEQR